MSPKPSNSSQVLTLEATRRPEPTMSDLGSKLDRIISILTVAESKAERRHDQLIERFDQMISLLTGRRGQEGASGEQGPQV